MDRLRVVLVIVFFVALLGIHRSMMIVENRPLSSPSKERSRGPVDAQSSQLPNPPNARAVIPLLLTSTRYHGTTLFATTLQGWILKFLVPQGNIDVIVFFDYEEIRVRDLVNLLRLKKAPGNQEKIMRMRINVTMTPADVDVLGDGRFTTFFHPTYEIRIHPVLLRYPEYILKNRTLLDDPKWLRCGCPPVCPEKRASVGYVQGTRWYTYDMFLQPILHEYSYWIKMDVDIWIFREIPFNVVETMEDSKAIFAHTGYIYNGNGCSKELHFAIEQFLKQNNMTAVSANERWWIQDDNVYYSNFVVSSMKFHLSKDHLGLAHYLNEYPSGFFRYRWTDQSLFHKVFGVFWGPKESDFLLDWSHLRWSKKTYRKGSVFYHSKGKKSSKLLRQHTDI
jgi:hypothetical protein